MRIACKSARGDARLARRTSNQQEQVAADANKCLVTHSMANALNEPSHNDKQQVDGGQNWARVCAVKALAASLSATGLFSMCVFVRPELDDETEKESSLDR